MNWITAQKDSPTGTLVADRDDAFQAIEQFEILQWLEELAEDSSRRYAGGDGATLKLQTGYAWRTLRKRLEKRSELEIVQLLGALLRYANTDRDEASRVLFSAYVPLSLEHEAFREYLGFESQGQLTNPRRSFALVRRTLKRWCEWVESLSHWGAHNRVRPGNTRRYQLDQMLILLWPLARRYQWTASEFLSVLCLVSRTAPKWFCQSPNELGTRLKAVGLNQQLRDETEEENPPRGSSVALRYSHFWITQGFQNRIQIP